jgi:phospholipid/cholesterol/gamma-HCH transport system substrate-binding protein
VSTPSNHWKLGLFVVVGTGMFLAMLVFFGAQSLKKETVTYKTYFDESVQGLDVGSPVKFRGVMLGNVSDIDIAADRRHVEVSCDLGVSELESLSLLDPTSVRRQLGFGKKDPVILSVPPDLRMQLGSAGITGVKFVQIDFFDVKDNPPPVLPFPTPKNYVPAAPSTMKNLEDAVVKAVDRFPEIADQIIAVMGQANHLLHGVSDQRLTERAGATIATADETLALIRTALAQANVAKLSGDAQKSIEGLTDAVVHLTALMTRIDGEQGLLASAQRATDSLGDLAGGAKGLGSELEDTLRDIRETVDSIQRLADALDTDSDMLLKGRAKGRP